MKLFPVEDLEYCTNLAIQEEYEKGDIPPFNAVAFISVWFASRRKSMGPKYGYRKDLLWMNNTHEDKPFPNLLKTLTRPSMQLFEGIFLLIESLLWAHYLRRGIESTGSAV